MKFGKYYRALDHVIVAMNSMGAGKPVLAAKHLQQAMKCKDFEQVIAVLDEANDVKAAVQSKPTLAQALTIVAAKAKPKKKAGAKKPFGGKQAPPFKKKAKANTLVISEVDLDGEDGLTEDDLLLDDDEVADVTDVVVEDDGSDGEDLDLDSLSLDDDVEEMADFDLDDTVLDESDDVMEMPEATSAEAEDSDEDSEDDDESESEEEANVESAAKPKKKAGAKKPFGGKQAPPFKKKVKAETLGTDEEIKPGSDGVPDEEDVSETDTQPKSGIDAESQIAKSKTLAKKSATAAARRLLSNLSVLEQQSAAAKTKVAK
jgi:hypothetical protein